MSEHDWILHLSVGSANCVESKSQKSVTLLLSKAEFIALSDSLRR